MPTITDIPGLLVGHAHDSEALTGVTVVLAPVGTVGGVDVRGGAPGTRETDLLDPTAMVQVVHAVALCGGSAFGLEAATGVVRWLSDHGIGFPTGVRSVPIVPAAVIFDLGIGLPHHPDAAMGYAACASAATTVDEGNVGAGIGASIGKLLRGGAMKAGVGTWSATLPDGTIIGALVVCNAFGDVYAADGRLLAGARDPATGHLVDTTALIRTPRGLVALGGTPIVEHTTIAVVATNAQLTKAEATKLAQMAQDGLARAIRPVHTPLDGDTVFVLATGTHPTPPMTALGTLAADVLAQAVERSVVMATALGGLPSIHELRNR